MTKEEVPITLSLLARYPVLEEARDLAAAFEVQELLVRKELLSKAEARVISAIERGELGSIIPSDDPLEGLLLFGLGQLIVAATGDPWLRRRWALAEARRMERELTKDTDANAFMLSESLGIRASQCSPEEEEKTGYQYKVYVIDYLRLTKTIDGTEWRLVNRTLWKGWVYLRRSELVRLLAEEVESRILRRLEELKVTKVPDEVKEPVERIRGMLMTRFARALPSAEVSSKDESKWPPCMIALKNVLLSGSKAGHFANFALASFLLSLGYSVEEVVAFYSQRPDFNERIARYQVEHIAGQRGSRTKYSVPSCQTMKLHGLCVEDGRHCPKGIRKPTEFYLQTKKAEVKKT